jgi:hypothetical protein
MSKYFPQYSVFEHLQSENCIFLGYYTVSSGNSLLMFLIPEDVTDRLSQNIGNKLLLVTA